MPERRQRRNAKGGLVAFPARPLSVPVPPKTFLVAIKERWEIFWKSELAGMVAETDGTAILRLFTLYDERERAYRAFRRQRLIKGSQGQAVLSPMGRAMQEFDAEIRQMEDRLGLSPRARLQLGITFGQAAQTLADLNRQLDEDSDSADDHGETEQADPRAV